MHHLPDFAHATLVYASTALTSPETQEREARVLSMCTEPAAHCAAADETSVKQGTRGQKLGGIP